MDDAARVEDTPAVAENEALLLPAGLALTCAVVVSSIFVLILLNRRHGRQPLVDQRFKGEEYFQAVVGEVNSFVDVGGVEQGCQWSQNGEEVEICAALPEGARAKDCQCKVLERAMTLTILGQLMIKVWRPRARFASALSNAMPLSWLLAGRILSKGCPRRGELDYR
jgi:hypothetical protein